VIALTCAEVRHLVTADDPRTRTRHGLPGGLSIWRRRHQHRARTSHYQPQQTTRSYP
jgi:hypothetical protein